MSRRSNRLALLVAVLVSSSLLAPGVAAQAKGGPKSKSRTPRGVITLAEVTITGRIQKPIAAVDVSRIRPKLTLSELRQPLIERIRRSIYADPL